MDDGARACIDEKKDAVDRAIAKRKRKTWVDVIDDYIAASPEGFGKTKTANLAYLQRLDFGKMGVDSTDSYDFFSTWRKTCCAECRPRLRSPNSTARSTIPCSRECRRR